MSYDFDVSRSACDHKVTRERMLLDYDLKTLVFAEVPEFRMRGSVSSSASVRVFLGGQEIPRNHSSMSWSLQEDDMSLDPTYPKRKIVFNLPQRFSGSLIEIDYITIPAHCSKCKGSGFKNDLTVNKSNSFMHITEHDKLLQRVLKFMLTSQCEFYPSFTSPLKDLVGEKFGGSLSEEDIGSFISEALQNLKSVQLDQKMFQTLSPQEVLRDILEIRAVRAEDDPSRVRVAVQVSSYGKERPTPLSFSMRTTR